MLYVLSLVIKGEEGGCIWSTNYITYFNVLEWEYF
jgi:hypothetical protein